LFSVHVVFFRIIVPGICLKRNIPVRNEQQLKRDCQNIYRTHHIDEQLGKVKINEGERRGRNDK
jgi:hypothetical protein